MAWCKDCEDYMLYPSSHVCPPMFLSELIDGYSEAHPTRAHNAQAAAEKFCELHDAGGDYDIISTGEAEVRVTDPRTGEVTLWDITAESVPSYSANAKGGDA